MSETQTPGDAPEQTETTGESAVTEADEVTLTPEQVAIVREEISLERGRPMRDPQIGGCMVAFFGIVILTMTPSIGRWVEIPQVLATALLILAAVLLFGGAALSLFSGRIRKKADIGIAEDALVHLPKEGASPDDSKALRAAVRLLRHAFTTHGPTTFASYEAREMAGRLGRSLLLVQAVERVLVRHDGEYPVFTDPVRVRKLPD